MYCENCNKNLSKEYVLCLDCGTPLRVVPTSSSGSTNDTSTSPQFNKEVPSPPNGLENKWSTYLVLSILSFLCCNQISGIVGIIFSCMANNDYTAGKYESYKKNIKVVKLALIIGLVFSLIVGLFYVFVMGLSFMEMSY
jgi:hypothetical protein